jgi:aryl-alcohol dehydrogenase-like predicted oxidoreductase
VSVLGLGCANFGRHNPKKSRLTEDESRAIMSAALDAGVTFFDTADSYDDSEEVIGRFLHGHRDDVVLATKFGNNLKGALGRDFEARTSRRYIVKAVERSLRRLQTDWIDLYQLHTPDPRTPIEETLAALTDLVQSGKVRYVGSSNLRGWQIADAEAVARAARLERFTSAQNRYNLLERDKEAEVAAACAHYGIGIIAWGPLADGLLSGKYRAQTAPERDSRLAMWDLSVSQRDFERIEQLRALADEQGVDLLSVGLGGLAAEVSVVSMIAGATSVDQVKANAAAAQWQPSAGTLAAIRRICCG